MLAFRYFLRQYRVDLFTALSALILYVITYSFTDDPKQLLYVSIFITLASLVVIVYTRMRERNFYFVSLQHREHRDDWIGVGSFDYDRTHNAYRITNSESGYIYSRCFTWSNYTLRFDFRILNLCLGVIVRAVNLSNLVMLQIQQDRIVPHIRGNSFWNARREETMQYGTPLNLERWYRCHVTCDRDAIHVRITDGSTQTQVFNGDWVIPLGIQLLFAVDQPPVPTTEQPRTVPFSVNLEYGTMGFRNSGRENAVVKNVLIEKVSN